LYLNHFGFNYITKAVHFGRPFYLACFLIVITKLIFANMVRVLKTFSKLFLSIVLFFCTNTLRAQDLSFEGMWKGLLSQNDKSLMYEVILKLYYETDSTLFGTSKIISRSGDYVEYYIEGKFDGQKLNFTDVTLMKESGGNEKNPWCLKNYFANIEIDKDAWIMKGEWNSPVGGYVNGEFKNDSTLCQPGKFNLKKIKGYANQSETDGEKVRYFQGRLVEIQDIVDVHSDTVFLSIIDNNQEDNDTVTIFFNKQLVVKQHRLSHQNFDFPIVISKEKNLLVIFANNTGDIPRIQQPYIFSKME
jgi:hypothetical protein